MKDILTRFGLSGVVSPMSVQQLHGSEIALVGRKMESSQSILVFGVHKVLEAILGVSGALGAKVLHVVEIPLENLNIFGVIGSLMESSIALMIAH